ncbi:MAG: PspC domain-containing protein [Bacteroidota bacterium]
MARERYRRRSSIAEEFDTSLMYDDIEKIREREQEEEKDQNAKLGSAGLMSLLAGGGLVVLGVLFNNVATPELAEFLMVSLNIIGFGALGYGFFKTLKLAFRQKELNFPALNVYRKTQPKPKTATNNPQREEGRQQARTYSRAGQQSRGRYQQRASTYRREGGKKTLRRSRTNRVFSGVAGGLAEYLGVSPALVRFGFIAGLFMTFFMSIFIYLLLSIVLPANYDNYNTVPGTGPGSGPGPRRRPGQS